AIQTTVSQGTLAVGTNVTLVHGGVELYSQKADSSGMTNFNLTAGSYFVLLQRGGYPLHVSLINVEGNANFTLNIRQQISYASAYGCIGGASNFSQTSISVYSDEKISGKYAPDKNGCYIVQFLPEGNYNMVFESSGFQPQTTSVYLRTSEFLETNIVLVPVAVQSQLPPEITISSPKTSEISSIIEMVLYANGAPLANQEISVLTPDGAISAITDSQGKARVNGVKPGAYIFTYKGMTTTTTITAPAKEEKPANASTVATAPIETVVPPSSASASSDDGTWAIILVAFVAVVCAVVGVFAIIFVMRSQRKGQSGEHAKEHAKHNKR
ncbi:MAG: hypothetical protein NT051_07180, partial [Candidatus Micrarchaeota archaeon]|nr:hypothetical protein [Candidatus Micrarchaeota archaeon]